jgi:hypothetical protein
VVSEVFLKYYGGAYRRRFNMEAVLIGLRGESWFSAYKQNLLFSVQTGWRSGVRIG